MVKRIFNRVNFCLFLITLITITLYARQLQRGEMWYPDAARHAMDAVLIKDLIMDRPGDIVDYVLQYYARYPVITLGQYPFVFHGIEALAFLVAGISVVVARTTVLLFVITGAVFLFLLLRLFYEDGIAMAGTLFFITNPLIFLWGRENMLEIPALSLIICSFLMLCKYLHSHREKYFCLFILCSITSMWIKQTAIIILPVAFLMYLFTENRPPVFLKRKNWLLFAMLFLSVAVLLVITMFVVKHNLKLVIEPENVKDFSRFNVLNWYYYISCLSSILPRHILLLCLLSLIVCLMRRDKRVLLPLVWILCFYFIFSLIGVKTKRFACFWIPPLCMLSVHVFSLGHNKRFIKYFSYAVLMLLCLYNLVHTWQRKLPYFSGPCEAARHATEYSKGKCILLCADELIDGNFAFYVRKFDVRRRYILLRADKILPAYTENNIEDIFYRFGINMLVVEVYGNNFISEAKIFSDLIENQKLLLKKSIKISNNFDKFYNFESLLSHYLFKNAFLFIYEFCDIHAVEQKREILVPIPKIGKIIKLKPK